MIADFDPPLNLNEDLANQIRFGTEYVKACQQNHATPGRFLGIEVAEWMSGLPTHWTDATTPVDPDMFAAMFPDAMTKAHFLSIPVSQSENVLIS